MALSDKKFPEWGDNGVSPPDGQQYEGGDTYNAAYVDYLWSNLHQLEEDIITKFNTGLDATTYKGVDINDDGGNSVDEADFAHNANATQFKGQDIDVDGDGIVNRAQEVVNYKQTCTIPKTTIGQGDDAIQELYVPSGYEIEFYRCGVEPNGSVVPSGLQVKAIDTTNDVFFFQSSSRFEELNADFTAQPGPIKVEMGVYNDSSTQTIASGTLVYKIFDSEYEG